MPDGEFYTDAYNEKYKDHGENPFIEASEQPVSTFAIDADGASYANTRRFLYLGQLPPKESVRIEEYINYFMFDYDEPAAGENIALNSELTVCPWNEQHHLLRLGIKGKTIPESELPPSNFVFLIDVSGSMNSPDKLGLLKTGFKQMTDGLKDNDKVAIVTYSGSVKVLLESTPASEKEKIKKAIDKLSASGSTAGGDAIVKAYDIAERNFVEGGNNRIIMGTDGDFNVGISSTEELVKLIEEKRDKGIFVTVLGVGGGNLNDHMMEQVANKGNGTYEYIDNAAQIQKVFIHERLKFYTVAKDSKVQITFNPAMVRSYRLIGYENRALNEEDFVNDNVDAGEIGSGQTITALYELALAGEDKGEEYAVFDFRYKFPDQEQSRPLTLKIDTPPVKIANATENTRFAASVVAFGLLMKQSEYKGTADKEMVLELGNPAIRFDPHEYRKEYLDLVKQVDF